MALTKVRSPVTEISEMAFGTTDITIASSGGPIDIDVAGVDIVDYTSTTVIYDPAIPVTANDFNTEVITLVTGGGATAILQTGATEASLETTTAHPLEIGANSITGMTVETDGKTTLEVEGTAIGHLVTKAYVDSVASSATVNLADVVVNDVINGSLQLPNSTGNDLILNWGVTASIAGIGSPVTVTFDTAFVTAFFAGGATRVLANGEAAAHYFNPTITNMEVVNTGSASSPVAWFAIGS